MSTTPRAAHPGPAPGTPATDSAREISSSERLARYVEAMRTKYVAAIQLGNHSALWWIERNVLGRLPDYLEHMPCGETARRIAEVLCRAALVGDRPAMLNVPMLMAALSTELRDPVEASDDPAVSLAGRVRTRTQGDEGGPWGERADADADADEAAPPRRRVRSRR